MPLSQPKNPRAVVATGRRGDLIGLFSILKHFHDSGQQHDLVFCGEFHSLVLGITYAHAVPVRFTPNQVAKAVAWAETRYEKVLRLHEFGPGYVGDFSVPYNLRQWTKSGLTRENFHDLVGFPLLFDRRDSNREDFLFNRTVHATKPLILVALKGTSSPFNGHAALLAGITRKFEKRCTILNLSEVKAARLYDLLVFLDRAAALVCVDSSLLHLAAAVPTLPVITLLNPNPLTASLPRYKPALSLTYPEWNRRVSEIYRTLEIILLTQRGEQV